MISCRKERKSEKKRLTVRKTDAERACDWAFVCVLQVRKIIKCPNNKKIHNENMTKNHLDLFNPAID
jgi:hypothetical protein